MKIGEALLKTGLISSGELEIALQEQEKTKERLGDIVIKMGFVSTDKMYPFLASHFNLQYVDLKELYKDIKPEVISTLSEELAHRFTVFPIGRENGTLTLAMFDPLDVVAVDTVKIRTGLKIKRVVASEKDIIDAIGHSYFQLPQMKEHIDDFIELESQERSEDDFEKLRIEASDPPVVKYVDSLIVQAVNSDASDIHLLPKDKQAELRLRVDGILYSMDPPPKAMLPAITTRIKILANLDIAERRLPQDGRFKIKIRNIEIDVRTSCFPTIYGESMVMRLLDTSSPLVGLGKLGFAPENLERYRSLIHRSYGLILVTGPTGSGKTSTLYSSLAEIKSAEKNIVTLEDPVEYRLPCIQQSQVNSAIGFDFARGLRSMLRQDPDVIMVGEIRDKETAEIAIHSALTGHLVFATLHTNDSAGAAIRLTNMGIEPFLITSSMLGVLAQRLVRCLCPYCKKEEPLSKKAIEKLSLGKDVTTFFKSVGCPKCTNRGFKGRTAIFELLIPDDTIKNLILSRASSDEVRRHAQTAGMKTMLESGVEKLKAGITTPEEILRATQEAEGF